jgi:hypothetical protein
MGKPSPTVASHPVVESVPSGVLGDAPSPALAAYVKHRAANPRRRLKPTGHAGSVRTIADVPTSLAVITM